jgi:hypothetical protein
LRPRGKHSLPDRLVRADIMTMEIKHLLIGICADLPNSADKTCMARQIQGNIRIRIGAVAQILRDYPEQALSNPDNLTEIERIREIIHNLPTNIKNEVLARLNKSAQSLRDNAVNQEEKRDDREYRKTTRR